MLPRKSEINLFGIRGLKPNSCRFMIFWTELGWLTIIQTVGSVWFGPFRNRLDHTKLYYFLKIHNYFVCTGVQQSQALQYLDLVKRVGLELRTLLTSVDTLVPLFPSSAHKEVSRHLHRYSTCQSKLARTNLILSTQPDNMSLENNLIATRKELFKKCEVWYSCRCFHCSASIDTKR